MRRHYFRPYVTSKRLPKTSRRDVELECGREEVEDTKRTLNEMDLGVDLKMTHGGFMGQKFHLNPPPPPPCERAIGVHCFR